MNQLARYAIVGLIILTPVSASAFFSFGGRIITVVPCLSALGPSLHITIVPAGLFPVAYIWTPATFTFLAGPPRNPGQQVLGLYDVPFVCTIGFPPIPLPGLRMFMVGTSAVL
jgi:hypothetical protein